MNTFPLFTATLLFFVATASNAASITVAVASNFTKPMQVLTSEFEKTHHHKVNLSFNSSGKIFAQIQHGAPYDAFFSADQAKPEKLETLEFTQPDSRFTYAIGRLAIWSADTKTINTKDGSFDPASLKSPAFKKIAIANPKLAPYGLAAIQSIDALGLTSIVDNRLVKGENISQTYQFTLTGNAQAGFVALSQIFSGGKITKGSAWIIPDHLHQPIKQDAVIIQRDRTIEEQVAVNDFFKFIKSSTAKNIISNYGYKVSNQGVN